MLQEATVRKLVAMGVVVVSITVFGTSLAQNTTQSTQHQPPALESQSPKTAPPQARTKSAARAQQYKTEDEAKSQCGTDQVVWGNTRSHILHNPGTQYYEKTIEGAYMCKAKAIAAGYRMPYTPESPVQHRVVIQVDQDDPAIMNLVLNNADNMRKYYEGKSEKIDIEVVAFGGGLTMMRADKSPVIDRLVAMSRQGVVFSGCSNTKANQSKAEGEEIRLLDGVHEVPTGVVRITELQEQGWTYLRP
jgi:uncharacterized protein